MASKLKKLSVAADIFEQSVDGSIRKIPLNQIKPTADQPRQNKDANISALASSLHQDGLLQPIVVTKSGNSEYYIIAGERRFRAAKSLGWPEIECRILHREGREKFKLAVIENLQRENLDPVEEAKAFKRLKDEFNYTDQELAAVIGKSRNYINEILSITEIPADIVDSAREEGVNQKNMLVQLAIANKTGKAEDFIDAVKDGEITTVKKAKTFNQQQKSEKKPVTAQPAEQKNEEKMPITEHISINLSWENENVITINGSIKISREFESPLNEIEDKLKEFLKTAF